MSINLNRFDLISLRLFVAVLDTGSLTAGAEQLGLSVGAASKRISEMESHVGVRLFERRKTGVLATSSGRILHRYAVDMVVKLDDMALAVEDLMHGVIGHLKLVANTSSFGGFLPQLLAEYSSRFPDVALDLKDALSEDAVKAVVGGSAELAVIGDNTPVGSLQTIVCDRDELVLAVPNGHQLGKSNEVPLEVALEYDFVTLERSTSLTRQVAAAAAFSNQRLKIRAQVRSFDAMARMVAAGLGIAIMPKRGASLFRDALNLQLLSIAGTNLDRVLLLAMRNRASLSVPARSFVEIIEENAQAS